MSYEPVITEATNTTRLSPQQLRAIAECLDEMDAAMHVQMDLLRSFGYGPLGDGSGAITCVTDGTAQNNLRRLADEMEAAIDASETGAPGPPGPNITGEWEAGTANIRAWVRGGGVFTPYLCAELEAWLNFFRGSNTGGIEGDKA